MNQTRTLSNSNKNGQKAAVAARLRSASMLSASMLSAGTATVSRVRVSCAARSAHTRAQTTFTRFTRSQNQTLQARRK